MSILAVKTPPSLKAVTGPVLARSLMASVPEYQPRMDAGLNGRRIHFMGAGGIGVSALMELCAARGAIVSGCDCSSGGQVATLRAKGIKIETGHCASHIANCDELVYTAAVNQTHPEVAEALRAGKTVSPRMHMLGRIARGTRGVCVTGAHGKTTTTWLIANMLITAQRDPSVLVGGVVQKLGGNVRVGKGREFVAEVDESDNRLHEVVPTIPVLTNIDNDHLDNYGTVDAIEVATERFVGSLDARDPLSVLIGCGDDVRVRRVLSNASRASRRPVLAYGFATSNDVCAIHLRSEGLGWRFDVLGPFGYWKDVELPMPGQHNVLNALAAICVGWHLGLEQDVIRKSFSEIERVARRFEIKGTVRGIRVIDDYGHHPTEIAATLDAARASTTGRLAVIFQPHRFSRTSQLMDQFADCFHAAQKVILMPIYAASEKPIPGVDHYALARAVLSHGQIDVEVVGSRADAITAAVAWAKSGDTIMTQGAGDITRAGDELVSRL